MRVLIRNVGIGIDPLFIYYCFHMFLMIREVPPGGGYHRTGGRQPTTSDRARAGPRTQFREVPPKGVEWNSVRYQRGGTTLKERWYVISLVGQP